MCEIDIYDIDRIFALNPDMKISLQHLGKYELPLLIIDDFYKEPELVREVLIHTPVPKITSSRHNKYPGHRVSMRGFINSDRFQNELSDILKKYFQLPFDLENENREFLCNIFDGSGPAKENYNFLPHYDPPIVAVLVYLNYASEVVGGTSVYRHRASNLPFYPTSKFQFDWWFKRVAAVEKRTLWEIVQEHRYKVEHYTDSMFAKESSDFILESNEEWDIVATVEAKFNRMAAYLGATIHSPMIDYDELAASEYKRINQVLFMNHKSTIQKQKNSEISTIWDYIKLLERNRR
jgi:hypothetical protein